jgi:hypothetical protein
MHRPARNHQHAQIESAPCYAGLGNPALHVQALLTKDVNQLCDFMFEIGENPQ